MQLTTEKNYFKNRQVDIDELLFSQLKLGSIDPKKSKLIGKIAKIITENFDLLAIEQKRASKPFDRNQNPLIKLFRKRRSGKIHRYVGFDNGISLLLIENNLIVEEINKLNLTRLEENLKSLRSLLSR